MGFVLGNIDSGEKGAEPVAEPEPVPVPVPMQQQQPVQQQQQPVVTGLPNWMPAPQPTQNGGNNAGPEAVSARVTRAAATAGVQNGIPSRGIGAAITSPPNLCGGEGLTISYFRFGSPLCCLRLKIDEKVLWLHFALSSLSYLGVYLGNSEAKPVRDGYFCIMNCFCCFSYVCSELLCSMACGGAPMGLGWGHGGRAQSFLIWSVGLEVVLRWAATDIIQALLSYPSLMMRVSEENGILAYLLGFGLLLIDIEFSFKFSVFLK
ncbi:hypothetical protein RIF29_16965 [Crotalaria pallida]|uniref:Uncharacterized protein n=1 Tax=Crotalaria pallida TaxID=3830 RepID=A0AAN9FHK8_CROPI